MGPRGWLVALPLALGVSLTLVAAKPAATKRKLESVVQELKETRANLREVTRDERETTRLLSQLDQQLVVARRELAELEPQAQALEVEVKALRRKVAVDVDSVSQLKDRVRSRLRALARVGSYSHLRVLLASGSLHDLAFRRALLARVAAHDAALLTALQAGKAELRSDRSQLEQRYGKLKAARDLAAQALAELEQSRQERSEAILALGSMRGALELRVDALRESQNKLKREIWSQSGAKVDPVGLATERGQLPWPLVAKRERPPVPGEGGGPALSGWILRAPLGTRVKSISSGRVVHAGFLRGYGLLVIVDHGHGYHSLFAHLSRSAVKVGGQVQAGDLVGYVGDTESLDGAKLYFELRRGGRPVNLGRWLTPTPVAP